MENRKVNINTVAFFNILGPIILNGINFFTIPIFTRILGTDHYGLYTIYYTWVSVMTILVSLQVTGTVPVANVRMEESERKKYYSSILSLVCIVFGIWLLIILLGMSYFEKYLGLSRPMIILMMFHALGMAFVNFATTRYTNEKRSYLTFCISTVIAILGVFLSLVLIQKVEWTEKTLYYGRAYGVAVPYIIIGLGFGLVFLVQGRSFYNKQYWKFCLPMCLPIMFHGISQLILAQADKMMLKSMMNDSMVGIYSFTYTFANVTNIIYNAFNNTWVPFYFEDLKKERFENIERRSKNYIFLFTALSVGFMLLSPDVIKIFAGKEFWTGISLVPILVMANYMIFLYSFPVNYEFYYKKSIHIAIGTSAAAIINCVLNAILIPQFGMEGAAYATLISYVLLWIFHHLVSKYIIKRRYHYKIKTFVPGLIIMAVSSGVIYKIENVIWLRWILAGVVAVILLRHLIKTRSVF